MYCYYIHNSIIIVKLNHFSLVACSAEVTGYKTTAVLMFTGPVRKTYTSDIYQQHMDTARELPALLHVRYCNNYSSESAEIQ